MNLAISAGDIKFRTRPKIRVIKPDNGHAALLVG
jgi:hypothetical protein